MTKFAASTTKSDPENGDFIHQWCCFSFLCWPKGRFGQSSCDSSTVSNWSPPWQRTVFPVFVSLCLISPIEILLKFKKKIQKVGVSNRFGWTTKQTFLRLEQRHSWPCQIKPNHTSKSSHPIFEHLKTWKKKTWFLEFWFHIKLARPSTGWFQGSPPWSRCHIYPRPPQTRQTFQVVHRKKDPNLWRSKGSKGFPKVAKFRYSQWNVSAYAMSEWYESA